NGERSMALPATIYKLSVALSDVDRARYETLQLVVARHPSETMRYMLTRVVAYCLSYDEGIAFSKGGVSNTDEAPVSIRSLDGRLLAWIDVGHPSAERLHKAAKSAQSVSVWTFRDVALLQKEAAQKRVHRGNQIRVIYLDPAFLDAVEPK